MIGRDGDGLEVVGRLERVLGVRLCGVELRPSQNQQLDLRVQAKSPRAAGLESESKFRPLVS